ncbi:MAG: MGMT family protein [Pseudomonadota bacterium]
MKGTIQAYKLKFGTVWIAKTIKGICKIDLSGKKNTFLQNLPKNIEWTEKKIDRSGKLPRGKLDLAAGTLFQQKVWRAIAKIPKGQTRSYAWLAKTAGRPKAVRAAANVCGANPIPLLIPCHRVIRSDGTIGGFSGPLRLKKLLLQEEADK